MMNCVSSSVVPVLEMSSCVGVYSERWYDDYVNGAHEDIAVDVNGCKLPFCVVLGIYGGKVVDLFMVEDWVKWRLTVKVFRSDGEMIEWMNEWDVDLLSEVVFVDKVIQENYNKSVIITKN